MADFKVSIIIPVYNASTYLRRCLDSCVNQTLKDIEIIVVNDCSPDLEDSEIMRKYEEMFPGKVTGIWHSDNKKPGGARNTGVLVATGQYLCFVDSDDYVDLQLCEKLFAFAEQNNADYVYCDHYEVKRNIKYVSRYNELDKDNETNLHPYCVMWGCLVKRELFTANNLRFAEGCLYSEDVPMIFLLLILSQRSKKLSEALYYYCINLQSLTQSSTYFDRIPYVYVAIVQTRQLNKTVLSDEDLFVFDSKIIVWLFDYLFILYGCVHKNNVEMFKENDHRNNIDTFKEYVHKNNIDMFKVIDFVRNRYKKEKMRVLWNLIQKQRSGSDLQSELLNFDISYIKKIFGELGLAGKRIVVWGTGERGVRLCTYLRKAGFAHKATDGNDKRYGEEVIDGVIVEPWDKLKDATDAVIVTPRLRFDEIRERISNEISVIDMEILLS